VSAGEKVLGIVATVVAALAIAAASQWSVRAGSDQALVRLSWRAEPIRVEECRTLTDEELAEIPAHMRRSEECTGLYVDYELRLVIDGREAYVDTIAPAGMRRDRPIYVIHDEPILAGDHEVTVRFSALLPEGYESDDGPAELEWSGPFPLAPYEVGLITLDADGASLERRVRAR